MSLYLINLTDVITSLQDIPITNRIEIITDQVFHIVQVVEVL